MSRPSRFPSHASARAAGWFSRRHETSAEHQIEQDRQAEINAVRRLRELSQLAAHTIDRPKEGK